MTSWRRLGPTHSQSPPPTTDPGTPINRPTVAVRLAAHDTFNIGEIFVIRSSLFPAWLVRLLPSIFFHKLEDFLVKEYCEKNHLYRLTEPAGLVRKEVDGCCVGCGELWQGEGREAVDCPGSSGHKPWRHHCPHLQTHTCTYTHLDQEFTQTTSTCAQL